MTTTVRVPTALRSLTGGADEVLCAGETVPMELRARARRDQVRASQRAIASIDRLFEAAGRPTITGTPDSCRLRA